MRSWASQMELKTSPTARGVVGWRRIGSKLCVGAVGVGVDEAALAGLAAEEVVDGGVEGLALDVPEGDVDGGDGGHGDGAASPIGSAVEVLPDVFGLEGVAAYEAGEDVVLQVA